MSGHAPTILRTSRYAWVDCECGWQSPVIRSGSRWMSHAAVASYVWARHVAGRALRRAGRKAAS